MTTLPPELKELTAVLDVQSVPTQAILHYGLALLMVESGTATLISTAPGKNGGLICTFQTTAGDVFNLTKPSLTTAQETIILQMVRQTLNDEDKL